MLLLMGDVIGGGCICILRGDDTADEAIEGNAESIEATWNDRWQPHASHIFSFEAGANKPQPSTRPDGWRLRQGPSIRPNHNTRVPKFLLVLFAIVSWHASWVS